MVTESVADIISMIEEVINQFPDYSIICGGNLNTNLCASSPSAFLIRQFMQDCNLEICDGVLSKSENILNYTYCHETLKHYSYIDYFLISKSLINLVQDFTIFESAINMSDHNAVIVYIKLEEITDKRIDNIQINNVLSVPNVKFQNSPVVKNEINSAHLRWDHANCHLYYSMTRDLFLCNNIVERIDLLESTIKGARGNMTNDAFAMDNAKYAEHCRHLDEIYVQSVSLLKSAAENTIPKLKSSFFKHWWNSQATELKQDSINTHREWLANGRPENGPIYEAKRIAKNLYKNYLRQQQDTEKDCVSNDLHDALLNKSQGCFWKVWNKKFGSKPKSSKIIEGLSDEKAIANAFAEHFAANSVNNNICNADVT